MKTERDLFNEWLKYYEKHDVVIDQLQRTFMWQAWQASVQREGYKLVPVEINDEIESAMFSSVARGDMPCEIYKDMIGVVP